LQISFRTDALFATYYSITAGIVKGVTGCRPACCGTEKAPLSTADSGAFAGVFSAF
jgi:hypothetical protein